MKIKKVIDRLIGINRFSILLICTFRENLNLHSVMIKTEQNLFFIISIFLICNRLLNQIIIFFLFSICKKIKIYRACLIIL